MQNQQIRLIARPVGDPKSTDFQITTEDIPTIQDGEVLVKNLYLSLDPSLRGHMDDRKSYIRPVQLGDVMRVAGAAGEIIESRHPDYAVGEVIYGGYGAQQYAAVSIKNAREAANAIKLDPSLASVPAQMNVLGLTGLTAYFGLLEVGQPKAGETVVVSAAAGATGATVGQIAKIKGCRVVGIAGGPEKCAFVVNELGFDACIDYKNENVRKALKEHCPEGIDVYFDNVGAEILDACLGLLRFRGRVVICGAIAGYNDTVPPKGPSNYLSLLINRGRMEGFIVLDYAAQYPQARAEMSDWLRAGSLKTREHIVEGGIPDFLPTLMMLFEGKNTGKLLLKIG